ncbi:MAG TPA: hypothetical protein VH684_05845 [Xanthobacteraceae bacterium]|jgi:hypothetical protein
MELMFDIVLGFVSFSAVVVLFASTIGLAIWLLLALAGLLARDDAPDP